MAIIIKPHIMSLPFKNNRDIKPLGFASCEDSGSEEQHDEEYFNDKLRSFKASNFTLSVKIIGNEKVREVAFALKQKNKVTFYRLQIQTMGQIYTIDKRYNDFKELHDTLTAHEDKYSFPDFPGRHY